MLKITFAVSGENKKIYLYFTIVYVNALYLNFHKSINVTKNIELEISNDHNKNLQTFDRLHWKSR
jgi:hypothetical protein